MQSNDLEDILIDKLGNHFKSNVKDFVITESSDMPYLRFVMDMTLYNYFVVRVNVERETVFVSIVQSGFQFKLFRAPLTMSNLESFIPQNLEQQAKLRIPDKYLATI